MLSSRDIGPTNNTSSPTHDGNCVFELVLYYGKGNHRSVEGKKSRWVVIVAIASMKGEGIFVVLID